MMAAAGAHSLVPHSAGAVTVVGGSDSPVPVWTAQVQQLHASSSSSSSLDGNSNGRMSSGSVGGLNPELCWQMVESGQTAQRRRRHVQRLFHQGRALLVKHLPRDVNEHVSTFFFYFFINENHKNRRNIVSFSQSWQSQTPPLAFLMCFLCRPFSFLKIDIVVVVVVL